MAKGDILNAIIRRDVVLTKFLLKIERETVGQLIASQESHDKEVTGLKAQLKTTAEQLRAERQKERRASPGGYERDLRARWGL